MNKTALALLACLSLTACYSASQVPNAYNQETAQTSTQGKTVVLESTSTTEHKTGDDARMEMERMDAEHAIGHMDAQ